MMIKTVTDKTESGFDSKVNQYLSSGYILTRRDIFWEEKGKFFFFYAELVSDVNTEVSEQESPVSFAESMRKYCVSVPSDECMEDRCPLVLYCDAIREGKTPEEWPSMFDVTSE